MENTGQKHRPHIEVGEDADKEEEEEFTVRNLCVFVLKSVLLKSSFSLLVKVDDPFVESIF